MASVKALARSAYVTNVWSVSITIVHPVNASGQNGMPFSNLYRSQ